ncbi:F0F1 ATP synthase subunit gamma, partial [candidate division WWE3 bacterium]|nr:F0F1 ATP synthase subunit gamma [candidate division WWE3 bacterium]
MSKLREIKKRIKSVNNISQVTNAMQLVAASRMRKAQDNASRGKQYADR